MSTDMRYMTYHHPNKSFVTTLDCKVSIGQVKGILGDYVKLVLESSTYKYFITYSLTFICTGIDDHDSCEANDDQQV